VTDEPLSTEERVAYLEARLAVIEEALARLGGEPVGVLEQNHRRVSAVMAAKRENRRTA
jgi:hypothetical protein